ncbi:enoyl-CoA hydratase [Candidatus Hepatincola sp. Av]
MDYLIVLFLTVLSPVTLHLSNVDYTTEWGISFSDPVHLNSQKSYALDNPDNPFSTLNEEYFGTYGIVYEMFIDYKFYVSEHTWLALRSAYSPLREGSQVTVQASLSPNPATVAYFYKEHPSFGLLAGYDIGLGFSPYIGASFSHIGYANYGNFELEEQFDSTFTYLAGIRYKIDYNWSALAEVSGYKMDMRYIEGQNYDIAMRVIKYKFGVVYSFAKPKDVRERNKDEQYKDIIRSLDPAIDDKIQEENIKKAKADKAAKQQTKGKGQATATGSAVKSSTAPANSTTSPSSNNTAITGAGATSSTVVGSSTSSTNSTATPSSNGAVSGNQASQPASATSANENTNTATNNAEKPATPKESTSNTDENSATKQAPTKGNSFNNDLF